MLHYGVIILVIIAIIWLQISFFLKNRKRQNELRSIFPLDCNSEIKISEKSGIAVIVPAAEAKFEQMAIDRANELAIIEKEIQTLKKELEQKSKQFQNLSNNNIPSDPSKREEVEMKTVTLKIEIEQLVSKIQHLIEKRENHQSVSILSTEDNQVKFTNSVFAMILSSINNYLVENKGAASDFHLIKDVIDRNCDNVEEEIETLTPIPLYLGLIGTMVGILVGVGFLVFSGGIDALLSTQDSGSSQSGVVELLGGVALAMSSSIVGILLTTIGSCFTKESKSVLNCNKNTFLSWIQVKLLPTLTGNATTAIYTLQQNLSTFNNTFASNIKEMGAAFTVANQAHQDQLKLMRLVEKMDVTRMAKANVEVLQELQRNAHEFEKFNHYLHSVTDYLDKVQALSSDINEHLNRTKAIEDMGVFFKEEIKQIEERKGIISKSVGSVDIILQNALGKLQHSAESQLNEFIKLSVNQQDRFSRTIEEQQATLSSTVLEQQMKFDKTIDDQRVLLQQRIEETSLLIDELKNLSAVKMSMSGIEKATSEQNKRIADLTSVIERLALRKVDASTGRSELPASIISTPEIPKWMKISIISALGIVSIAGLIYIIPHIIDFITLLKQ